MTSRIIAFLRRWPLHILLLPLYFIASVYAQYAGLFFASESVPVLLYVYASLGLAFALLYFIYKDKIKAGVVTTIGGILYLFFGNIKDLLRKTDFLEWISHYKTLVPLLFLLGGFLLYRLLKAKRPITLNLFLNILLIIYLLIETWNLSRISGPQQTGSQQPGIIMQATSTPGHDKPNIYYLLFDCYPGSGYQRDVLGVAHNELDTILRNKGFFVVDESRSNYHMTSFSMASLFNMDYLDWLKGVEKLKPFHYNRTIQVVKKAIVFKWLQESGYQLHNLSIFDMPGQPSPNKEKFLSTTGKEIILYNTFFKCLYRDVLPELFPSIRSGMIKKARDTRKKRLQQFGEHNRMVLDSLYRFSSQASTHRQRFIYAHVEMPHFPYFFDSSGRAYPDDLVFGKEIITNKERFKNYIGYSNRQITALIDSIFIHNQGRDIIILQSDHGLNDLDVRRKNDAFRNYTAFYFPDRNYDMLYNGMSNVNSFRIIFNKYFSQQLPLLHDSSSYIK